MQLVKRQSFVSLGMAGLLVLALTSQILVRQVHAADLSQVLVRFDRMQTSTASGGTVCANPTTVGTEVDVQVVFPTGYAVNTTAANWTITTTNTGWPAGANAWAGINTATAASGQTVTFPSSDLTVGTLYCFNFTGTSTLTTSASATNNNSGTVTTRATGPSTIDSGSYATATIAGDQITVTASVNQTFSFALSGTTDALGTLTTGSVSVSPTPRVATVNTNAKNGWYVWAKDASTGLNSASAAYTIGSTTPGSNSTLSAASEGYNTGVTQTQVGGSGTVTVAAPFVGGATGQGGGLNTTFAPLASSNGTANNAALTLTNNASISSTTAAASDYTDTITVVAAGLF